MRLRQITTVTASAVLLVPAALAAATPSASAAPRAVVASDQPAYTRSAPATAVAASSPLELRVDLALRDPAGASALVQAVSTPGSADYRNYLTPAQFRDAFGATQGSVDAVSSYLASQGLKVASVNPSRTSITATGTAAAVATAFGTSVKSYKTAESGALTATSGALTVPAALAPLVAGVRGLAESQHLNTPASKGEPDVPGSAQSGLRRDPTKVQKGGKGGAPPAPGFLNAQPCSSYFGEKTATGTPPVDGAVRPYVTCGYTPSQVQSAYGVSSSVHAASPIDGRGTTVAITDAYNSPTIVGDASTYAATNGSPALRPGQYSTVLPNKPFRYGYNDKVNGDQCGEQGWYGEQTLDVEAVHGIAPGADIVYVPARSCDNLDFGDALATIVDGHLADAISNSWGSTGEVDETATLQYYQAIFTQAAIEGIGVYFSSGDGGDNTGGDPAATPLVNLPASNPLVTAVGGTSLGVGKSGEYLFEDGWGTGKTILTNGAWTPTPPGPFTSGGGGGASTRFDQPFYQQGVVPDSLATKAGLGRKTRVLPDVSMVGDPNSGYLVGQTQTFLDGVRYSQYRLGGTSLSSPLMAGLVAIADQAAGFHHGFINPALYPLVGTSYVHDVKDPAITHYVVRKDYPADPATGISDPSGPVTTSLRAFNLTNTLKAAPGYDDITGVGSPNGLGFLTHLGSPPG